MNVRALDLEGLDFKEFVKSPAVRKIAAKKTIVFGGEEDGQEVCIAVYLQDTDDKERLRLIEDFAMGDTVEKKIEREIEMIDKSREILFSNGIKRIAIKAIGEAKDMQSMYQNAIKHKFIPLTVNGLFMVYKLDETVLSKGMQILSTAPDSLRKGVCEIEPDDVRLKRFLAKKNTTGIYFEKDSYDPSLSKFYVEDGEIKGALVCQKLAKNIILYPFFYVDNIEKNGKAFAVMFHDSLSDAAGTLGKEAYVVLQSFYENVEIGIEKILGKPIKTYEIHEYLSVKED